MKLFPCIVPAFNTLMSCCLHGVQLLREFASLEPGTPTVLLVSLKAGGVGLNLTSASHVHLLEPFWNPASALPSLFWFSFWQINFGCKLAALRVHVLSPLGPLPVRSRALVVPWPF